MNIGRKVHTVNTQALPTVALFGATGFSGRPVLDELLGRGHHVRALVRRPDALEPHPNLTALEGDALNATDVAEVLEGADVVVHCLGVGGKGDGKPTTLVSDSIDLVLNAMKTAPRRVVCMSNVGAGGSGPWLVNRLVVPLFFRWLRPLIDDKDRMEARLADSNVDWVAARFPNIVPGPAKEVRVDEDGRTISMSITTESVARYLADQVVADELPRRTPSVSN